MPSDLKDDNDDQSDDEESDGAICRNYENNQDNEFNCKSRCRMEMLQVYIFFNLKNIQKVFFSECANVRR